MPTGKFLNFQWSTLLKWPFSAIYESITPEKRFWLQKYPLELAH